MIKSFPDVTAVGLRQALSLETPASSKLVLLQILAEFEPPPLTISSALQDIFRTYSKSEHFGFRWLTTALLNRISKQPDIQLASSGLSLAVPVSRAKLELLSYLDRGARVETIAKIWSDFPSELVRAFDREYLNQEDNKKRSNDRHNLAKSRIYKVPETAMLFWEHEVFENIFYQVLTSISKYLMSKGIWKSGIEYSILYEVLPQIILHVRHWNSRIVRPPIPLPSAVKEDISTVSTIDHEDEFNGWYRCAYYEEELVVSDRYSPDVTEQVTATGGIVFSATPILAELKGNLPFGIGRAKVWLEPAILAPETKLSPFSGPLIGFDFISDYLGLKPLFMIHPRIAMRCGLQPGQQPGPLVLMDGNGEPACIFRYWSVRALGGNISEESPRLSGCDLIIRPDIFGRIKVMSQIPPVYMTTILRKPMKKD